MAASKETEWRPLARCSQKRRKWGASDVKSLANEFFHAMPARAQHMLNDKPFVGTSLIKFVDESGPQHQDLKRNAVLVRAAIRNFPDRVPVKFYIADVFLQMHHDSSGALLHCSDECPSVEERAMEEAAKLCRLVGYLRQLWRNATESFDPLINDLKANLGSGPRSASSSSGSEPPTAKKTKREDEQI